MKNILFTLVITIMSISYSFAGETPSHADAKVYFVNLKDGDKVSSPLTINFGLKNMGIAPAGVDKKNTGHHHLFLNRAPFGKGEDGADEADFSIPADENHIHYGGGQTETTLDLPKGKHTLQLVFGDKDHIPHNKPVVSKYITITVK